MKMKSHLLFVLSSCVFWAILFGIGFFNTAPSSGWNEVWFTLLILDAVVTAEALFLLTIVLIRKKMGYPDMM